MDIQYENKNENIVMKKHEKIFKVCTSNVLGQHPFVLL